MLASLALAAGCADLFGPPPARTIFALEAVDDAVLPSLLGEAGPFSAVFLDADSLVVFPNGTATWVRHTRLELDAGGPILNRIESTVEIRRDGTAFAFSAPGQCALSANCLDLAVATPARLPDEFIVRSADGARRYRRVSSAR